MEKKPLISIIVPVYNVEKYLARCIESLIGQSYKNLEIVLVDDGSTDNSGYLCDRYQDFDKRIRVIHKINGGLSEARNSGICACKGKYVLLVDSDDYIEKTACEELIQIAIETDADMVSFKENRIYENISKKISAKENSETKQIIILSSHEAGERYLYGNGLQHSAWSKLYKRELFNKLLFPVGLLAEDFATTYLYISFCNKIAIYDRKLYFYCIRENSIMTQASLKLVLDVYKTACEKYKFEKKNFPNQCRIIETAYCNCLLKTIARIYNENSNESKKERVAIEQKLKKVDLSLVPITTKGVYWIYQINKKLFAYIMKKIGLNG